MATHPTSLAAKLATLRQGETIYFDDRQAPGKPTIMERSIRNIIAKSPALAGRQFSTERLTAVRHIPPDARAILAVTRNL